MGDIKVLVDAGHGADTPGKRTAPFTKSVDIDKDGTIDVKAGERLKEHYINASVSYYLERALVRNGFLVVRSGWDDKNGKDDKVDVPLGSRQAIAKKAGADISVSIHANAFGSDSKFNEANGIETHVHSDKSKVKDSVRLANLVQNCLIKGTPQSNRGIKYSNLAMCNATAMGTNASILVELAFMTNQNEAENMLANEEYYIESAEEICEGVCKYYNRTYKKLIENPSVNHSDNISSNYHPILAKSECTAEQMANYLVQYNPDAKSFALNYAKLYLEEGEKEGVRGDAAFAQSCKETHYFKFDLGTAVTFDQNNFCGMGVLQKGMKGNSFTTPRLGIRAQIQHLKGYASSSPLTSECVDPRYKYISPKGKARTWEELAGNWAVPGYDTKLASSLEEAISKHIGYGFDIMNMIDKIKSMSTELFYALLTSNVFSIDTTVRGTLTVTYAGKDGIEVHNTPDFDKKSRNLRYGPVGPGTSKGSVFTVVGKTSNGMYKLKSGLYITASSKYVKFTKK